jgi:hypothetical protein
MSNETLSAILWIVAAVILVLYLMRRSKRKKAQ